MGGEDRLEVGPVDECRHVAGGDAGVDEAPDGLVKVAVGAGAADVEVLDAVHLLGHVGEVEVHGEGPHEPDGLVGAGGAEQVGELAGGALLAGALAEFAGEAAHVLDGRQQVGSVLADEGVAELPAEAPDVGAQAGVGGVGGPRGGGAVVGCGHDGNLDARHDSCQ